MAYAIIRSAICDNYNIFHSTGSRIAIIHNPAPASYETDAVETVVEIAAPFADYAEMTAKAIVTQLDDLTNEQLELVKKFEAANANRVTVMREVERRLKA